MIDIIITNRGTRPEEPEMSIKAQRATTEDAVDFAAHQCVDNFGYTFEATDRSLLLSTGNLKIVLPSGFIDVSLNEVVEFAPDPRNPIYLYVLVRTDMASLVGTPDNRKAGLPCAQTGHAANQMVYQVRQKNIQSLTDLLTEWENETGFGFGTEIVKGAHYSVIKQVVEQAALMGYHASMVKDPEYPLWDGDTLHLIPVETCAYIFGRRNDLDPLLRRFDLLP